MRLYRADRIYFFLKGRGKRLATPKYIRLESKEMEDTKPKRLEGRGKERKIKIKRAEEGPTRPDQQDLSYKQYPMTARAT